MSHSVLYFCWRGGRPRWIPPKKLRDLGYKGTDLKDEDGLWLPLEMALAEAREINKRVHEAGHMPEPAILFIERRKRVARAKVKATTQGFVYFARCGENVKIGFSIRPIYRVAAIVGSHPDPLTSLVVVRGTEAEERALQALLAEHRTGGEWFATMTRCVYAQRVVFGKTTPAKIVNRLEAPFGAS